jgi:methyl-accepting chemotaxis protein
MNLFSRFKRRRAADPEPVASLPDAAPAVDRSDAAMRVLARITEVCREISKGNFEARLVDIADEAPLADAQHAVNDMIDCCDAFVREATAAVDAVRHHKYYRRILREGLHGALDSAAETINAATAAIDRRASAFDANTAQFEQSIEGVVQTLTDASSAIGDTGQKLSHGAAVTRERSHEVAAATEDAAATVQTAAAAAAKLSGASQEIRGGIGRSAEIAGQAMERASAANRTMDEFAAAADRIGKAVELINAIAAQTNLLALNAAIEAAHAGESGKGFAVVAQEVKTLSGQTADATREIYNNIAAVQSIAKNAVEAIGAVATVVDELNQSTGQVMQAVVSQASATDEIVQKIDRVSTDIRDITSAMRDVTENAGDTESFAATTTIASTELLEQSHTLATDVQNFMLTLRRGAFDEATAPPKPQVA